jgi:lipooligosaccharide transport system permease protein
LTKKEELTKPIQAAGTTAGTTAAGTALRAHSPEVSAARARRWGAFYYAEQVLRVMKGYGWTIVMYGVGQPVAYLFAMGVGLATLVESNGAGVFGGVSYLTFIAPALLISAAVMTAANEFTFPVMDGFKWRRVYYGPHASPLTPEQIAGGQIIAVTVRFLLQSAIYFAVVALFGAAPGAWAWVSILIATLAGLSFGLPLMAYAATIQHDKGQFAMVMRFIVMPLFLFSGTFFPLDTLPLAVRWIGWISPIWHGTELGRVVSYGYEEAPWLTIVHVLFLLTLAVAGWVLTKRKFAKRMAS